MVQRAVLDSLVFQKPDGSFVPWLAKKWEVSEDGTAYTFHLRDDVTFTDGEKFDAAAVKANFDRIADPATKSAQAASMLGGELYKGTEVVDPTTVKVTFAQPYAPFLQAASTAQLGFYAPRCSRSTRRILPPAARASRWVRGRSRSRPTRRIRRSSTRATRSTPGRRRE